MEKSANKYLIIIGNINILIGNILKILYKIRFLSTKHGCDIHQMSVGIQDVYYLYMIHGIVNKVVS